MNSVILQAMKEQDVALRPSRPPVKDKAYRRDASIMGTNNSSIISKRSVERLYFPNEPHFFRYFVKKPRRRSPLINRGYWLRMRAVDHEVRQFLLQPSTKHKLVVNLGCGYDALPWQCLHRYPCDDVTFIDIDYKELMLKKRDIVQGTKELYSMLGNTEVLEDGNILLRSDKYLQLGCDLRNLSDLDRALASAFNVKECIVLLTAEVSITYMAVEAADALIRWAGKLPDSRFCLLEQLMPDGTDHPFARMMTAHFEKLQTPLKAVGKYPTVSAQEKRFQTLGWTSASARNLWELWSDSNFLTSAERRLLDIIEPFDEWEELALFGCHYFLLVANNATPAGDTTYVSKVPDTTQAKSSRPSIQLEMIYSENPKTQGCRRFAAALPVRCQNRTYCRIGNFAGMGLSARNNAYDVYTMDQIGSLPFNSHGSDVVPCSRMCHTITDLGDLGSLLVGGRSSPDNALADCWLYNKWLNAWERVDDLPQPRYRHGAVCLGEGRVLITPGRRDSRNIADNYLIWSRSFGWVECIHARTGIPRPTYGATFAMSGLESPLDLTSSIRGLITGGISDDAVLQQDIWEWQIRRYSSEEPFLSFRKVPEDSTLSQQRATISRFGAALLSHEGHCYIVGGIVQNELLTASNEICILNLKESTSVLSPIKVGSCLPRPMLVGCSVWCGRKTIVIMGGSAVCFSFGTFWNKGCFTIHTEDAANQSSFPVVAGKSNNPSQNWKYLHTVASAMSAESPMAIPLANRNLVGLPRVRVESPEAFNQVLEAANPVIIEGLDIGPCIELWTTKYLKERVGVDREVIVHEASTEHMSFTARNFAYVAKKFEEFIDQVNNGAKFYLRSLSMDKPADLPADLSRDFPSIAHDFRIPPELADILKNIHSSPLRISGPVIMWLHYDVMANVLCQIRGSKRLLLFPPLDVKHLGFEPGASSSSVNVFDKLDECSLPFTHPHEAMLHPGDILFLPPLWLHSALPISPGMSIAVNVFFRNLTAGYAAGKDVYGNRDLQPYEKGRQDLAKVIKSFDNLPSVVRGFYLQRLADELALKVS